MTKRKQKRANSTRLTQNSYVKAELNIRARFSKWMNIEDPTKLEYAYFTKSELIDKYAKEIAFWICESHISEVPCDPVLLAEKMLANQTYGGVIDITKRKFKNDLDMLTTICNKSLEYHKLYSGKDMDPLYQSLLFTVQS